MKAAQTSSMAAAIAMTPLAAEAATGSVTPSLKNLLLSVLAGGVVLVGIAGAIAIQSFEDDQLDRTIVVMVMFGVATVIFGALWALILRKAFDPPAAKLDPSDDKTVDPSAIALGDKGFDDHDV